MSHGEFLKEVGVKVRAARKKRRMPLTELAAKCGTNLTQLSFIENGKCNWHILTLRNIADVFNMDLKDFF